MEPDKAAPFFRICNAEVVNISICNAKKQRYAAFVPWQPPNAVDLEGFSEKMCIEAMFLGKSVFLHRKITEKVCF